MSRVHLLPNPPAKPRINNYRPDPIDCPWLVNQAPPTTKVIADAAHRGEAAALAIMHEAGERFGEMLAILVDLFNPERIVLGGFYPHCRSLLDPTLHAALAREALPNPLRRCEILPSALGDTIGSHGAIATALHAASAGNLP